VRLDAQDLTALNTRRSTLANALQYGYGILWDDTARASNDICITHIPRANELLPSPPDAKYKLCVVQFKVPGAQNGGSDKGPDGNRIDSIPIANGVIHAGGACDLILYDASKNKKDTKQFESIIVSDIACTLVRLTGRHLC